MSRENFFSCMVFVVFAGASMACAAAPADRRFEAVANRYVERFLATHPETATELGDHRFDGRVGDFSMRGVAADRALFRKTLKELATIPADQLSLDNRVDRSILQNNLEAALFDIEVMHEPVYNPLNYNPAQGIYSLVARDFAPLASRLASVDARLKALPMTLLAAQHNLKNPPRVFTETAILQNKGAISLVKSGLDEYLDKEAGMRAKLAPARARAVIALTAYGKWLEQDLLPRSQGDFRIGAERFRAKLRLTLDSDLTPETILKNAQTELVATQAEMFKTALPMYRSAYPNRPTEGVEAKVIVRAVLDKLAESRPDNTTIVDDAKKDLTAATAWVRDHNLVSLPIDPVQVIVMPEHQRGVAVAFCESAGALEKNGTTLFVISPTPSDWTPERTTSFFREYNNAMLNELTVHEAMPGHYLQLAAGNKARAPTKVRALAYSGTFVEGWATYAEQVMADSGFGGPETRMQELKMRLRLIINAIIDQKIHAENMSEQEAMNLMMGEGFQEEGEAAGKWRRARLSSTQLSTYYVGNLELNALARDLKAKAGGDLRSVHDRMLGYGSIATKYVRELAGI